MTRTAAVAEPTPETAQRQPHEQQLRVWTLGEMMELPPPEWLIDRVLPKQALGILFGPAAHGKSFVALDMALSVATGRGWFDHQTARGQVIYVVAEGGRGMVSRVKAWLHHHRVPRVDQAFFILEAPQLLDSNDLNLLVDRVVADQRVPALIVLDTLARCFVGGEENSARDVGRLIAAASTIQRRTEAAILLVHHTGKSRQDIERGSSALRGAADVMVRQNKTSGLIRIENDKQKDADEFPPFSCRLLEVVVPPGDAGQPSVQSCVVVEAQAPPDQPTGQDALPAGPRAALRALGSLGPGPQAQAVWRNALETNVSDSTFRRHRAELGRRELVERVSERPSLYQLTEAGRSLFDTDQ